MTAAIALMNSTTLRLGSTVDEISYDLMLSRCQGFELVNVLTQNVRELDGGRRSGPMEDRAAHVYDSVSIVGTTKPVSVSSGLLVSERKFLATWR
jgi:hypothetical protein